MRKQNVSLRSTSGIHFRWMSLEEIDRMVEAGQVRRVSKRKDPRQVYQLIAVAPPSTSEPSRPPLGPSDMYALHKLKPFEVERLTPAKVAAMAAKSPGKLRTLQRLSGWGLIARNEHLENAGEVMG